MPVWMVASRWLARAGLCARIRDRAILTALVMFTRAGTGQVIPGPLREDRHPEPAGGAERGRQQLGCPLPVTGLVASRQQAGQVGLGPGRPRLGADTRVQVQGVAQVQFRGFQVAGGQRREPEVAVDRAGAYFQVSTTRPR